MKFKKSLACIIFLGMAMSSVHARMFSASECLALEYAIDDASTSGQHTMANLLFGIYDGGGCWPLL